MNRAMKALMQAEAARETQQRLLGQQAGLFGDDVEQGSGIDTSRGLNWPQAEKILEACGRVLPEAPSAMGQLQPAPLMPLSAPAVQVWQPASAMRQLRQLVPRFGRSAGYPEQRPGVK